MNERCENVLIIKGENSLLEKFDKEFSGEYIGYVYNPKSKDLIKEVYSGYSLENFIPRDREVYERQDCEWETNNWGSMTDILNGEKISLCKTKDYYTYLFSTGFFAPVHVVKKMSERYSELEFEIRYVEAGKLYAGAIIFKSGNIINSNIIGPDKVEVQKFVEKYIEDK